VGVTVKDFIDSCRNLTVVVREEGVVVVIVVVVEEERGVAMVGNRVGVRGGCTNL
jgi:hypothetical protein